MLDAMVTENDYTIRQAYEHQRFVAADMTRHRLEELNTRYAGEASDEPTIKARHAAVRDEQGACGGAAGVRFRFVDRRADR